jgi:hypothetical protein
MTDASSSAETQAASTVRTRGAPRFFWVGMAVFLILIVFLGFGSTYGRQLLLGTEIGADGPYDGGVVETDWVIHLHAAVFVGWLALLLGQTVLAARGRMRAHMTLGSYGGLTLGIAVVLVGFLITYQQATSAVAKDLVTWAEWPKILLGTMPSWFSLLGFAVLFGLGLRHRNRPAVHKRHMICGTILLVVAATSRMDYLLGSWANTIGIAVMVAPLLAYDLYTERRVRPATLIGTGWIGALLVVEYL